jgi:hypothetical protein
MRRHEVIKKIKKEAKAQAVDWALVRQGANHEIYSLGGTIVPIPRHTEIDDQFARTIWKECEVQLGKGWWR